MKKLKGVLIIGWLKIISGLIGFMSIVAVLLLPANPEKTAFLFEKVKISIYDPLVWVGFIFLGKNILSLKEWARKATIVVALLLIIASAYLILSQRSNIYNLNTFVLIFAFFELFYLINPSVKKQFK